MIAQRPIRLEPRAQYLEVWKITYPPVEAARQRILLEPMLYIPHSGRAQHG